MNEINREYNSDVFGLWDARWRGLDEGIGLGMSISKGIAKIDILVISRGFM